MGRPYAPDTCVTQGWTGLDGTRCNCARPQWNPYTMYGGEGGIRIHPILAYILAYIRYHHIAGMDAADHQMGSGGVSDMPASRGSTVLLYMTVPSCSS